MFIRAPKLNTSFYTQQCFPCPGSDTGAGGRVAAGEKASHTNKQTNNQSSHSNKLAAGAELATGKGAGRAESSSGNVKLKKNRTRRKRRRRYRCCRGLRAKKMCLLGNSSKVQAQFRAC